MSTLCKLDILLGNTVLVVSVVVSNPDVYHLKTRILIQASSNSVAIQLLLFINQSNNKFEKNGIFLELQKKTLFS